MTDHLERDTNGTGIAFADILRMHRIPAPSEVTDMSNRQAESDAAKLRSAMESHPLESLDALGRLRLLEKQEEGELKYRRDAWYAQDLGILSTKVMNSVVDATRDVWDLKAGTLEELLVELGRIFRTKDRPVYLVIFGIFVLVLLRARGEADPPRKQ